MRKPFYVAYNDRTDNEPAGGWYFEVEREYDSAPVTYGAFKTLKEAEEYYYDMFQVEVTCVSRSND